MKPFVAYCLTGKGAPPKSPPAADPRPGREPFNGPSAARPTTRITPLEEDCTKWADKMLADRNRIVSKKGFDIVLLGDALLAGQAGKAVAKAEGGDKASVLDLAYPGDRTENVLWRAMYGELEGYKAKCIVVAAGTENRDDRPEDIAAGVGAILDTVKSKHPKAKAVLVPVAAPQGAKPQDRERVRRTNELLKKLAAEKGAAFGFPG